MGTILAITLARARRRTVACGLGLALFLLVVGLSYASVDANQIRTVVEDLPPALRALASSSDLASPAGYLGGGFLHPVALALQAGLAISMAAAVARDVEDGVAELILSRPLPRWQWLLAQALAMTIWLLVAATAGVIGAGVAVLTVDDLGPVSLWALVQVGAGGFLLALAVGAVALVAASVARTGGRVVLWTIGFVVVSYAVEYLSRIWSVIEPLGPLSVFHHYDAPRALADGGLALAGTLTLVLVALAAGALAHLLTERRELAP